MSDRTSKLAVGMRVTDSRWGDEWAEMFKVFTFAESDDRAVLLQDCTGREDALAYLAGG